MRVPEPEEDKGEEFHKQSKKDCVERICAEEQQEHIR